MPRRGGRRLTFTCGLALLVGLFTSSPALAQTLSLGSVRTEAERAALRLAVEYAEGIGDIFAVRAPEAAANRSFTIVDLSPSVVIETGGEDTFNSVIGKIAGNVIFGVLTEQNGLITPCIDCFFHVLTVSAGFEADRGFDNTAFLVEAGYVPWFQGRFADGFPVLGASSIGLFVQAGYKADTAGSSDVASGADGAADESAEDPDSGVFRLRGDYKLAPIPLVPVGDNQMALLGEASGWRDLVNGEWYYRLRGGIRLTLAGAQAFDVLYEKGSGAPNFNEGDQFSANLSITF